MLKWLKGFGKVSIFAVNIYEGMPRHYQSTLFINKRLESHQFSAVIASNVWLVKGSNVQVYKHKLVNYSVLFINNISIQLEIRLNCKLLNMPNTLSHQRNIETDLLCTTAHNFPIPGFVHGIQVIIIIITKQNL